MPDLAKWDLSSLFISNIDKLQQETFELLQESKLEFMNGSKIVSKPQITRESSRYVEYVGIGARKEKCMTFNYKIVSKSGMIYTLFAEASLKDRWILISVILDDDNSGCWKIY